MSIDQAQREIVDEFGFFEDWMSRYQYLIDLGRKLPPLQPGEMRDDKLLAGCQSQVWLLVSGDSDRLEFRANSDAAIVSGLVALLLRVYSGRSAAEILNSEPWFVEELGLSRHLSPTRSTGLHAMLDAIRGHARDSLNEHHSEPTT